MALCGVCRDFPGTVLEFLPGTKEFDEDVYQLMTSMSLAAQRPLNWNVFVPGNPSIDKSQLGATHFALKRGADVIALTPAQPVITRINLHSAFIFDAFHGWEDTMRLPIPQRIAALREPELWRRLDAGAHLDMIDTFSFSTQLLGNAVSKRQLLSVEQAVHHLTEAPAKLVGLKERGLLKEGYCADIVVFNLDKVACGDTYTRHDLPGGAGRLYADARVIEHVYVNGREIIRHNEFTGALPGKILRAGADTATVAMPGDYS